MAYTTIKKPSDYFNTVTYTGNGTAIGSGGNTVTGVGFQPDFVWGKARSGTDAVDNHQLIDVVRGVTKSLISNNTTVEGTYTEGLTSFTSDGFTLGSNGMLNRDGNNCVAWNWLGANGTASNTDGSITSTVSANTTSGFSIVSYTGTATNPSTIGHGLGVAPKIVIVKRRNNVDGWQVYVDGLSSVNHYLRLDDLAAEASDSTRFGAAPTTSVFTVGNANGTNASGDTYIAYCFADVKGFSKFGSYTGNGNADGTFVYTGFKPAFVINKRTDSIGNWNMRDIKRDINENTNILYSNLNNAEASGQGIDFLSNGFKQRNNGGDNNGSGASYIYMAFAEEPLVGDNPATAR